MRLSLAKCMRSAILYMSQNGLYEGGKMAEQTSLEIEMERSFRVGCLAR